MIKRLKPIHVDDRGSIIKILEKKVTSVLLIPSKKGAVRSNHYHKKDWHYIYIINGKLKYTYKNMRTKKSRKRSVILTTGDLVYTPAMMAHATEFLEDTLILALTKQSRASKNYEADTVRIKLI